MTAGFDQLLREHGVRVTAQRLAIMQVVAGRPHATADELTEDVRGIIGTISRQAVYDTLGVLVDKNLVRRIQPAGAAAWYENRVSDNHHHLICRLCHAVIDIDCAVGDTPCLTVDHDHGFQIDEAEVVYWGLCPTCQDTTHMAPAHSPSPASPSIDRTTATSRTTATLTEENQ